MNAIIRVDPPPKEIAHQVRDLVNRDRSTILVNKFLHERDQIDWMSSILVDGVRSTFATHEKPKPNSETKGWKRVYELGRLALNDGREYLIPLQSRLAAVNALRIYNAQSIKARLAKRLLAMGLRLGVAQPFLRKANLGVSRDLSQKGAAGELLLEHLREVLGRQDLAFAISLGTPGPHRKLVVQILTSDGEILGYAKVGRDDATNALVQNEVRALQVLAATSLQALAVPRVLHSGWWGRHFLCVLSALEGVQDRAPRTLTSLHLAALKELRGVQTVWLPLEETPFWGTLSQRVQQVDSTYHRSVLEQGMVKAAAWVGRTPLPFHFCHGDFTPWNMKQSGKKLFVLDWEYASEAGLSAWDLFHFLFQTVWLVRKRGAGEIYASLMENKPSHRQLEDVLVDFSLEETYLKPLLLLYVLDRLAFRAVTNPEDLPLLRTLSTMVKDTVWCRKGEKLNVPYAEVSQ